MVPLFLVLIGAAFLLQALGVLTAYFVAIVWPILLILIGLQKAMASACRCCCEKK
jgi:hypothetical protein